MITQDMKHIVALSGGKDSTAMALKLAEVEPRDYQFVCTPTGNELEEMEQHWKSLGDRLGSPIIHLPNKSLEDLIQIQNCLPNWQMRWCTRLIKIKPFEQYVRDNTPCVVYVGIRADESGDREGVDYDSIPGVARRFPLDEWGWNLFDVLNYLESVGQTIPRRTDCAWCFFQTKWEWYVLWRDHRDLWMKGEHYEQITGHTFRSMNKDNWPAGMKYMRDLFEAGIVPKGKKEKRTSMCSVCAR